MESMDEAFMKDHNHNKDFWENELKLLSIEPKRRNELNEKV